MKSTYDHGWVGSESRMEKRIESALLAFAKLVLEREPSEETLDIGASAFLMAKKEKTHLGHTLNAAYRAIAAELIKELTEDGSTIGSHQPKEQP